MAGDTKGKSYLAASLDFMVRRDPKDLDIIKSYAVNAGDSRVVDYASKEEQRLRAAAKATFAKVENDPQKLQQRVDELTAVVRRTGPGTGMN